MKLRQYIAENRDKIDIYTRDILNIELDSGEELTDDLREEFIYNDDTLRELAIEEGVDEFPYDTALWLTPAENTK
jgi:hypothetical protein